MERKAVIDLGTNTFNLLVFEALQSADGSTGLKIIHSSDMPVFLGRGGLEKGMIAYDAFDRGIAALETFSSKAIGLGVKKITGFGCSTLRNSANAGAFIQAAAVRGVEIVVLRGEEEAGIILDGVRQAIAFGDKPALVMDIGGGSIEFILATNKSLMWMQSFELGVTRLRERMPVSDPITVDEELRIAEHLDAHLEPLWHIIDRHEPHLLAGSAGSFDSLARMIASARGDDLDARTNSMHFHADEFHALKDRILRMDRAERLKVPGLPEHRVDTIIPALIAIERVLIAGGIREMAWSGYSLKEGAAWRLLNNGSVSSDRN